MCLTGMSIFASDICRKYPDVTLAILVRAKFAWLAPVRRLSPTEQSKLQNGTEYTSASPQI